MNRSHMNTLKNIDGLYVDTINAALYHATDEERETFRDLLEKHKDLAAYHPDTLKLIGTLYKRKQAKEQGIL